MKNYDEASVLKELKSKRSISISNKVIHISKNAIDVGNNTWGKIDYLCHYCGYSYLMVDTIINEKPNNDNEEKRRKPKAKERFSMSKMVKNAMR